MSYNLKTKAVREKIFPYLKNTCKRIEIETKQNLQETNNLSSFVDLWNSKLGSIEGIFRYLCYTKSFMCKVMDLEGEM